MEFQFVEDLFLKCALPNGGRILEMWNVPIQSRFMACHQKAENKRYYVIDINGDKHLGLPCRCYVNNAISTFSSFSVMFSWC